MSKDAFSRMVREGVAPESAIADGVRALATATAADESARPGQERNL